MMDMRERKYVKFRINMYEDTKFKIIDMKPERDLNTIETLAIEFNRDINQIRLALEAFIELEMIEITEDNVYRLKNFAKHQNIKVKETIKTINEISG